MTTLAFVDDRTVSLRIASLERSGMTPVKHVPGVVTVQLHDELWRVTRPDGEVLGYIERFREREGYRFRAKRLMGRQRQFFAMGEFWSIDDTVEVFRPQ